MDYKNDGAQSKISITYGSDNDDSPSGSGCQSGQLGEGTGATGTLGTSSSDSFEGDNYSRQRFQGITDFKIISQLASDYEDQLAEVDERIKKAENRISEYTLRKHRLQSKLDSLKLMVDEVLK